jgi:hypothetical protein
MGHAPYDWCHSPGSGRRHIVNALVEEDAPVVDHEARADLLRLLPHGAALVQYSCTTAIGKRITHSCFLSGTFLMSS